MADSLIGSVVDGVYKKTDASKEATKSNSEISTSKTAETKENGYTQDMFMKLLVAEMQYQDPLEPTDNSQYVAQLASFTQIEAIQAVQDNMKAIQGNSMVGKMVALVDDDNKEIHGRVDYVRTDDNGDLVASISGKEYPVDKIKSIMDETYYNSILVADTILAEIQKLPSVELLTLADEEALTNINTMIGSIDNYTKGFLGEDAIKYVEKLMEQLAKLKADKAAAEKEVDSRTNPTGATSTESNTTDTTAAETNASATNTSEDGESSTEEGQS